MTCGFTRLPNAIVRGAVRLPDGRKISLVSACRHQRHHLVLSRSERER
jgi:hypothetical protein